MTRTPVSKPQVTRPERAYRSLLKGVVALLDEARRSSVRTVNALMTATYWDIGRRIVEFEQEGQARAIYGSARLERLSEDLVDQFGRGFSVDNLENMRRFYLVYKHLPISETLSRKLPLPDLFPLPWSHYVRLLSVEDTKARAFYEAEALRGGWSVRQLDRQISTLFYERKKLSRDRSAARPGSDPDGVGDDIKDPFVLEFLGLKDEYSETHLEEALVHHLENFLLELGNDFTFVARQKRLRIGSEWYRIDLLFFHRRLRCLVVIDLKVGKFTHADAGQMNLYLNYAREHWIHADENPPIGLVLCSKGDQAVAHYALGNLSHKVFTAEYRLALPDEKKLVKEMEKTRRSLEKRKSLPAPERRARPKKISETVSRKSGNPTGAGSPRASRPRRDAPPRSRRPVRPPGGAPS